MTPRIWLIAGPTASGKSALALRLAEAVGGEILGADALQLYADLPILSAAPTAADRARIPHHLVGVADAADPWSVGRWRRAAAEVLAGLGGRSAVVAGGTGLYFRALTQGLADIPPIPAAVRQESEALFLDLGEPAFRAGLAEVDPTAAVRIAPGDRQRLVRAWAVWRGTGRSISQWQAGGDVGALDHWTGVALTPPAEALYPRCDARFEQMLAHGALDEVRTLAARDLDPALPALKAVGYRELSAHLQGELSLDEATALAQRETRRYAKRQSTWIRGQMAGWARISDLDLDAQWRSFLALHPDLTP